MTQTCGKQVHGWVVQKLYSIKNQDGSTMVKRRPAMLPEEAEHVLKPSQAALCAPEW